jgi:hypothetical protein
MLFRIYISTTPCTRQFEHHFKDGTRNEAEARGNKKIIDEYSQDYTKWELVDKVGNVFNRLVLFKTVSRQYGLFRDKQRERTSISSIFLLGGEINNN